MVDIDLEKFFDSVNHDILMGFLVNRLGDLNAHTLVRRYLTSGVLRVRELTRKTQGHWDDFRAL